MNAYETKAFGAGVGTESWGTRRGRARNRDMHVRAPNKGSARTFSKPIFRRLPAASTNKVDIFLAGTYLQSDMYPLVTPATYVCRYVEPSEHLGQDALSETPPALPEFWTVW